jgi:hypothetical protein
MPQLDPDQEAALRRLIAAFGPVEVLEVVDHVEDAPEPTQGRLPGAWSVGHDPKSPGEAD